MMKRTLVFSSPMILSLKNQQLVLAYKDSPDEKRTVPIEDVGVILLENQQTNITLPLLNALAEAEVQVVICNNKGMPSAMIQSMNSNNLQGETLRNQISCGEVLKKQLWKQIVEVKIKNQASLLNIQYFCQHFHDIRKTKCLSRYVVVCDVRFACDDQKGAKRCDSVS